MSNGQQKEKEKEKKRKKCNFDVSRWIGAALRQGDVPRHMGRCTIMCRFILCGLTVAL